MRRDVKKHSKATLKFYAAEERRHAAINADWLADHPGKTATDAERAGTCGDTPVGRRAQSKWYAERYGDRDPLDCPRGIATRTVSVHVERNSEPPTRTVLVHVERSKPKTRTVRVIKSG